MIEQVRQVDVFSRAVHQLYTLLYDDVAMEVIVRLPPRGALEG